jgi:hypothetical protein
MAEIPGVIFIIAKMGMVLEAGRGPLFVPGVVGSPSIEGAVGGQDVEIMAVLQCRLA